MERSKSNTRIAGIDVGKRRLDVALHGQEEALAVDNDRAGIERLIDWLASRGVARVGLEATGGYERAVREALALAGLEVVMHQPLEVRLFARLKRLKAKNDRLDAALIAAATAQVDAVRAASDPRLSQLAERLTAYEQMSDQAAQMKTYLEHVTLKDIARSYQAQIRSLESLKARLLKDILALVAVHPDLAARLALLRSLPGFGPVVAVAVLIRMPELGALEPGKAAALLGVAPFDSESGQHKGQRFIQGGRARPRRLVYIAALAAKRIDTGFTAFAERLKSKGKPPKLILVAIMRKLIEAANLILSQQRPWQTRPAQ
jgi:transposase